MERGVAVVGSGVLVLHIVNDEPTHFQLPPLGHPMKQSVPVIARGVLVLSVVKDELKYLEIVFLGCNVQRRHSSKWGRIAVLDI